MERMDDLSREEKRAADRAAGTYDKEYILGPEFEVK